MVRKLDRMCSHCYDSSTVMRANPPQSATVAVALNESRLKSRYTARLVCVAQNTRDKSIRFWGRMGDNDKRFLGRNDEKPLGETTSKFLKETRSDLWGKTPRHQFTMRTTLMGSDALRTHVKNGVQTRTRRISPKSVDAPHRPVQRLVVQNTHSE